MIRIFFTTILCLLFCVQATAQDTSRLRISLLTCTPGDELYSIFGHSAIRVMDSTAMTDIVFNYGTFNFDDKNFYLKFARGKLDYFLSLEYFNDFRDLYQYTGRGITEQVLNIPAGEKIAFHKALLENAKEENRYYQYDFFFDNCTTRLRDLILKYKTPTPELPATMLSGTRFREAIHIYLNNGKQYWSKLGIDILLGAPTDAVMTPHQQQFLPDNLMRALDSSRNTQVVASKADLYQPPGLEPDSSIFTPVTVFWGSLAVMLYLSFFPSVQARRLALRLDGMIFFLTGLLGVILILMWTGTDHSMTKENYNLLWAIPSHIIIAFFMYSKKKWVRVYFGITTLLMGGLLLAWFLLPQQMNNSLIPVVMILLIRSGLKYFSYGKQNDFVESR